MLEIFSAKETLPRSLIEKVICFDRVKDYISENQFNGVLDSGIIKDMMQKTHEALNQLKVRTQIKISQQATESNEDTISSTTDLLNNANSQQDAGFKLSTSNESICRDYAGSNRGISEFKNLLK